MNELQRRKVAHAKHPGKHAVGPLGGDAPAFGAGPAGTRLAPVTGDLTRDLYGAIFGAARAAAAAAVPQHSNSREVGFSRWGGAAVVRRALPIVVLAAGHTAGGRLRGTRQPGSEGPLGSPAAETAGGPLPPTFVTDLSLYAGRRPAGTAAATCAVSAREQELLGGGGVMKGCDRPTKRQWKAKQRTVKGQGKDSETKGCCSPDTHQRSLCAVRSSQRAQSQAGPAAAADGGAGSARRWRQRWAEGRKERHCLRHEGDGTRKAKAVPQARGRWNTQGEGKAKAAVARRRSARRWDGRHNP